MVIIGLDIETTGGSHHICEFAAVAIEAETGKEIFKVASLVNPGSVEWNPFVMKIHGITPTTVRGSPGLLEVWNSFESKLSPYKSKSRCFAHNAAFERTHLTKGLGRKYALSLECTIALAKLRITSDSYKLPLVCAALGIPFRETHRAEADARAAAQITQRLLAGGCSLDSASAAPRPPTYSAPPQRPTSQVRLALNASRGINSEILASTQHVSSAFSGKRVCITGVFPSGMTKEDGKRRIAANGGIPVDSVTRLTDLVVLAASNDPVRSTDLTTEKAIKARANGIRIISGAEFIRRTSR